MAFDTDTYWSIGYRTAATDFKFIHTMRLGPTGNEALAKNHFLRHTNKDVQIEWFDKIAKDGQHEAAVAKVLKDAGPSYRPLQDREQHMTKADVARARGEPVPDEALTPEEQASAARSAMLVDPPELPQ